MNVSCNNEIKGEYDGLVGRVRFAWEPENLDEMGIGRSDATMHEQCSKRELGQPSVDDDDDDAQYYRGYIHINPFSILEYYDCNKSIILDGMHCMSNVVNLICNLTSGNQMDKLASKVMSDYRGRQRQALQLKRLADWGLKDEGQKQIVIDRYNSLVGPTDFIEHNKGPYQLGNDQSHFLVFCFNLSIYDFVFVCCLCFLNFVFACFQFCSCFCL
jgi:hypothetical protein